MGGLGTGFVAEGFWDSLGGQMAAAYTTLIQHTRNIAKDAQVCELLRPWLHQQFSKQPCVIKFLRIKNYEDNMKS